MAEPNPEDRCGRCKHAAALFLHFYNALTRKDENVETRLAFVAFALLFAGQPGEGLVAKVSADLEASGVAPENIMRARLLVMIGALGAIQQQARQN